MINTIILKTKNLLNNYINILFYDSFLLKIIKTFKIKFIIVKIYDLSAKNLIFKN